MSCFVHKVLTPSEVENWSGPSPFYYEYESTTVSQVLRYLIFWGISCPCL